MFEFLFPNGIFSVVVLSALNQKIYSYPQKIPLGSLPVTYIVFPNSLFAVEQLKIKQLKDTMGSALWFAEEWFVFIKANWIAVGCRNNI